MNNLATLTERHGIDVHEHLDRDQLVPVLTQPQVQGDVGIWPAAGMDLFEGPWATTPVPKIGTPVVRGENGGNTHAIVADGPVFCDLRTATVNDLTLALLAVPPGSVAYLAHPEHGYAGIGPGSYRLTRQRQQAEQIQMVAD